jgi:hypothetical protein
MKIEIELTEYYVDQLREAGFTEEQIEEYAIITANSWFEDVSLFDADMEGIIENMQEYYGQ